jgi:pimeloyl-ACP methyl ester carboxylesterase
VLLHGILADHRAWQRQIASLSGEFTVISIDLPGCGESDDPPETYRLPDFADCLASLLHAIDIDRAHLVGSSWGGGLALQFAAGHPARVQSLVLAGAYAGWSGSLPADAVEQRLQQAMVEAELPAADFVPGWLPGLLTDAASTELRNELSGMMADFHPAGYRVMARAFAEADLRGELPSLRVPVLLLWGADDKRAPIRVAEDMRAAIPAAELVVLPGGGHLSNIEVADDFNRELRTFLQKF